MAVKLGILITLTAMLTAIVLIVNYFIGRPYVTGWASIFLSLWFLVGIIITILGIMGVYLGKIFETVKGRPTYIVGERINYEKDLL